MPPVKPVPSLFNASLKCYARYCVKSLTSIYERVIQNDYENVFITWKLRRESLLRRAKKYVCEHTTMPIMNEVFKFLITEIMNWKPNNPHIDELHEFMNRKAISYRIDMLKIFSQRPYFQFDPCLHLYVLRDVFIMHGKEMVTNLDFHDKSKEEIFSFVCKWEKMVAIREMGIFRNKVMSKNLVSVRLGILCNFDIVRELGLYCFNLQYLDLSDWYHFYCSTTFDFSMFAYLYGKGEDGNVGCPKLNTIVFPVIPYGNKVQMMEHVVRMIQFMPDLQIIRNLDTRLIATYYMDLVGELCTMKLKEFEEWNEGSCTDSSYDLVNKELGKIFPNVVRYFFFKKGFAMCDPLGNRNFASLQNVFPSLQEIEICNIDMDMLHDMASIDPMPSLKKCCLKFEINDHISYRDIQILNAKFPNLEKLSLSCTDFDIDSEYVLPNETLFTKLVALKLVGVANDIVLVRVLKIFLENCPSLTSLDIITYNIESVSIFISPEEEDRMTDEFVELLSSRMVKLERVNIAPSFDQYKDYGRNRIWLTFNSVLCILSACPNLKILGDLKFWKLSISDFEMIDNLIKDNNWNLRIICGEGLFLLSSPCSSRDGSVVDSDEEEEDDW